MTRPSMHLQPLALAGAYRIELEPWWDDRGFFVEAFRAEMFEALGLPTRVAQMNISYNSKRGTLRGLHFQLPPHTETKLVRCIRGAVYDVVVDLRPASPTFRRWHGEELTAENRRGLFVPAGFAHGFQTLEDDTEVLYLVSEYFAPSHYRGVRWNDPALSVAWPDTPERIVHPRDEAYPDFSEDLVAAFAPGGQDRS